MKRRNHFFSPSGRRLNIALLIAILHFPMLFTFAADSPKSAPTDPDGDSDHDGLTNSEEIACGTKPKIADTDGDGTVDGIDGWALNPELSPPRISIPRYAVIKLSELGFPTDATPLAINDQLDVLASRFIPFEPGDPESGGRTFLFLLSGRTWTWRETGIEASIVWKAFAAPCANWSKYLLSPVGDVVGGQYTEDSESNIQITPCVWRNNTGQIEMLPVGPVNFPNTAQEAVFKGYATAFTSGGRILGYEFGKAYESIDNIDESVLAFTYDCEIGVDFSNGGTALGLSRFAKKAYHEVDPIVTPSTGMTFRPVCGNLNGKVLGVLKKWSGASLFNEAGYGILTDSQSITELEAGISDGFDGVGITDGPNPVVMLNSSFWKNEGTAWEKFKLNVWDCDQERVSNFNGLDINNRLVILDSEENIIRNARREGVSQLVKGWNKVKCISLNNSDVILAKGSFGSEENSQAVLLVPLEIRDVRNWNNANDDVFIEPMRDKPPGQSDDEYWKSATDRNIAFIVAHRNDGTEQANDPRMPQLEVKFPGLPAGLQVKWTFKCTYKRGNGLRSGIDTVNVTETTSGDQSWKLHQKDKWNDFFGGNCELTYQILKGDGSSLTPETTVNFVIGGLNPTMDNARDYIDQKVVAGINANLWFSYAIAKQESAYKDDKQKYYVQFYTWFRSKKYQNGQPWRGWRPRFPTFGDDRDKGESNGNGGYGIFQITQDRTIPLKDIWSWEENAWDAVREISSWRSEAEEWYRAVVRTWGTPPSNYIPPNPADEPALPSNKNLSATDWENIVLYNGPAGMGKNGRNRRLVGDNGKIKVFRASAWSFDGGRWSFHDNVNRYIYFVTQHVDPDSND